MTKQTQLEANWMVLIAKIILFSADEANQKRAGDLFSKPDRFRWFAASAERKCEITTPGMAGDAFSWRISWKLEFHDFLNIFAYFSIFFVIFQYSNVFFRIMYQISYQRVISDSSDIKNNEKSISMYNEYTMWKIWHLELGPLPVFLTKITPTDRPHTL